MIIVDNIVKADDGKLLLVNGDYRHEVHLGEEMILRDNEWTSQINSLDDIEEVTYTLFIDKMIYIKSTNYKDIVTELIRMKYSLDDELALIANSRLNPNSKEEQEFQDWRKLCKQKARELTNE